MKKVLFILSLSLSLFAWNSFSQTVNKALIYQGAVSWFSFDASGSDSTGSNELIPYHVNFLNDAVRGRVAEINHVDTGYFEFSKNPVSGEQFSISTWFYYKSTYKDYWQTIFEFVNDVSLNNFYLSPNFGTIGLVSENKTSSKWLDVPAVSYQTPVDMWVHLAVTFDGGNVIIYADGNPVASGSISNSMSSLNLNRFFIGVDPLRIWRAMDAMYDDFAVFNKVLTQSQVYALAHDTLAMPPLDAPYVFEGEDYVSGNWQTGKEADTTYSYYGFNPDSIPNAANSLQYGIINGQDQLFIWARIKTSVSVTLPFWIQIDNDSWKACNSLDSSSNWQWIQLQSLSPTAGSKHTIRLSPAAAGIKLDKALATYNWTFNPNIDYHKTDSLAPSEPGNLIISGTSEYSSLIKWHSSPAKDSISAYDLLNNGSIFLSTVDTFASPVLQASTHYNFSVRSKDRAGNISAASNSAVIATKELSFTADFKFTNQVIHHFGASDAWSVETLGLWPEAKRDSLAKLLFSRKLDNAGNAEGAGLSNWRFRIGDGSRDQQYSGFSAGNWFKSTHCFLDSAGNYNWNKQACSLWFLSKAKEYGVKHFTGWTDSPPYFMTKSGYVFRVTNVTSGYNLAPSNYSKYALFLANVANHFDSLGIHLDVISPVNEPQWSWDYAVGQGGQPGSFCSNSELTALVKAIDTVFRANNVSAKLLIDEAGSLDYLYSGSGGNTDNQVYSFWDPTSSLYLGNVQSLSFYVSGHGYFTETSVANTITSRRNLLSKLSITNPSLQYWQTEYSLLSDGYLERPNMKPIDYSLFIARVIHFDLTSGNCTGWDWWTAFSRPWAEDHKYRFALINWYPNVDDVSSTDGYFEITKNLWALGNFSHFVLPGYKRISVLRSDGLTPQQSSDKQLISAYLSPKSDTVVYVVINYADYDQNVKLGFRNLSFSDSIINFSYWVTSASDNLFAYPGFDMLHDTASVTVKARSISTFVGSIKKVVTGVPSVKPNNEKAEVLVYPNPANSQVTIETLHVNGSQVILYDLSGKQLSSYLMKDNKLIIDTHDFQAGCYSISITLQSGIISKKIIIIK